MAAVSKSLSRRLRRLVVAPRRPKGGSRRFFLRHRFLGNDDFWELHDVGNRLGSILTESRLERQFSVSDLGRVANEKDLRQRTKEFALR